MIDFKKLGIFAGGVLFGTAGIKILSSKDAKKAYTHTTAAVLRAKDCVMSTATILRKMQKIFSLTLRISMISVSKRIQKL